MANLHLRPLRLPVRLPACFASRQQWREYRKLADQSAKDGFTFCEDCTARYQKAMVLEGRCRYPHTVFHLFHGVTIGQRMK